MKGLHLKQIVDISLFQIHKKIKRLYFSHHDSGSDINFFLCFQLATKINMSFQSPDGKLWSLKIFLYNTM